MSRAYVTLRRPEEVARAVERLGREGCRTFFVSRLDGGGMLDQERLGAARYAAGLQADVELEGQSSPTIGSASGSGVEMSEAAAAR